MKSHRALIMGIDPGKSGAVAIIDPRTKAIVSLFDMPIQTLGKMRSINPYELELQIAKHADQIGLCVIEEVHSMPDQGVATTFEFGKAFGLAIGVVAAHLIPMRFMKPEVWKLIMGLSRDKNQSLAKATEFFPNEAHRWARKMDNGRAEAVCLAVLGAKAFGV